VGTGPQLAKSSRVAPKWCVANGLRPSGPFFTPTHCPPTTRPLKTPLRGAARTPLGMIWGGLPPTWAMAGPATLAQPTDFLVPWVFALPRIVVPPFIGLPIKHHAPPDTEPAHAWSCLTFEAFTAHEFEFLVLCDSIEREVLKLVIAKLTSLGYCLPV